VGRGTPCSTAIVADTASSMEQLAAAAAAIASGTAARDTAAHSTVQRLATRRWRLLATGGPHRFLVLLCARCGALGLAGLRRCRRRRRNFWPQSGSLLLRWRVLTALQHAARYIVVAPGGLAVGVASRSLVLL